MGGFHPSKILTFARNIKITTVYLCLVYNALGFNCYCVWYITLWVLITTVYLCLVYNALGFNYYCVSLFGI